MFIRTYDLNPHFVNGDVTEGGIIYYPYSKKASIFYCIGAIFPDFSKNACKERHIDNK